MRGRLIRRCVLSDDFWFMVDVCYFSICKAVCRLQKAETFCFHYKKKSVLPIKQIKRKHACLVNPEAFQSPISNSFNLKLIFSSSSLMVWVSHFSWTIGKLQNRYFIVNWYS
jgi:hypothetical protein|uniref:Uncharacterized protein n=1 Tax=Zea mays TaxID=4577 RepID=A0A804NAU9_MAIZE